MLMSTDCDGTYLSKAGDVMVCWCMRTEEGEEEDRGRRRRGRRAVYLAACLSCPSVSQCVMSIILSVCLSVFLFVSICVPVFMSVSLPSVR